MNKQIEELLPPGEYRLEIKAFKRKDGTWAVWPTPASYRILDSDAEVFAQYTLAPDLETLKQELAAARADNDRLYTALNDEVQISEALKQRSDLLEEAVKLISEARHIIRSHHLYTDDQLGEYEYRRDKFLTRAASHQAGGEK